MEGLGSIKVAKARAGQPLYLAVRDTLRDAIDAGVFCPGQRMPSTKQISEQLQVSLVTAHRALQELVGGGVLQRSQGRGTFVHERFRDRIRAASEVRIGLILHSGLSFADSHYCQILEGIRIGARELSADLILLRFNEDVRNECQGSLMVSPTREQVSQVVAANLQNPIVLVDASCIDAHPKVHCRCVDHRSVARLAVKHLTELGHRSIGYLGGGDHLANGREHWEGYVAACREFSIPVVSQQHLRSMCWRLDGPELKSLIGTLAAPQRPTAFYATGYSFAMDLYDAAAAANLDIPSDLSVVGVDDAAGAFHLHPPLTTVREPLLELGRASVRLLIDLIHHQIPTLQHQCVCGELVTRKSTAAPGTSVLK